MTSIHHILNNVFTGESISASPLLPLKNAPPIYEREYWHSIEEHEGCQRDPAQASGEGCKGVTHVYVLSGVACVVLQLKGNSRYEPCKGVECVEDEDPFLTL